MNRTAGTGGGAIPTAETRPGNNTAACDVLTPFEFGHENAAIGAARSPISASPRWGEGDDLIVSKSPIQM